MKNTLGIDFGGSSCKVTLLREDGEIISTESKEYPSYHPYPGWYEQDAVELFDTFVNAVRACLSKTNIDVNDICAVAFDAATHMAVLCDENDVPLRKFIHWSDSRSTKQAEFLEEHFSEILNRHTYNCVSSAWTLAQLLWIRENEPEVLDKTKKIYFAKDYIRSRITGDFLTDNIEVMGALLADDSTGEWCEELCAIAGLDVSMLPEIKRPDDIAGYVTEEAAAITGLAAGTPVIVGTTDTVMEIYAAGAVDKGAATIKLATAGRICPITSEPIFDKQFYNYRHIIPGLWYPGTTTRTCAASYKWFRDTFCAYEAFKADKSGENVYELMNREAEKCPAGSEGLFFHPYLQGEITPYHSDSLRASFTGVGINHGKGHFTRAVMEGVAYSMRDCMEVIKANNVPINQLRVIGGGAKGKLWRQILCDVLNMELVSTVNNDSSLGSAMLAGVAVGMFGNFRDSVDKCVKTADSVYPVKENVDIYSQGFEIYQKICAAMLPLYK